MNAFVLIGLLAAGNDTMKDLAVMQGEWKSVWVERDGDRVMVTRDWRHVIRGNKFYSNGSDKPGFSLKVQPKFTPKLLDLTVLAEGVPDYGQTREGLYRIEGDTLLLCWSLKTGGRERPLSLDGNGAITWCFRRVKQ